MVVVRVNGGEVASDVRRNVSNDENRNSVGQGKRQGGRRARGVDEVKKDGEMDNAVSVRKCVGGAKRNGSRGRVSCFVVVVLCIECEWYR